MSSRKLLLFLSLTAISTNTFAQNVAKSDFIQLNYTTQYYFNKANIENDNNQPNPISTINTTGNSFGLGYQHITKNGFTINATIQLGWQSHKVLVDHDLSNFDTAARISLHNVRHHAEYQLNTWFLNQRVMAGYIHSLSPRWYGEVKIGISAKTYFKEMEAYHFDNWAVTYKLDHSPVIRQEYFYTANIYIGNDGFNLVEKENNTSYSLETYIGVRREIKKGYLRNLFAGLEFTRTLAKKERYEALLIRSYNSDKLTSLDHYYNKNISLGLVVGAGFWF